MLLSLRSREFSGWLDQNEYTRERFPSIIYFQDDLASTPTRRSCMWARVRVYHKTVVSEDPDEKSTVFMRVQDRLIPQHRQDDLDNTVPRFTPTNRFRPWRFQEVFSTSKSWVEQFVVKSVFKSVPSLHEHEAVFVTRIQNQLADRHISTHTGRSQITLNSTTPQSCGEKTSYNSRHGCACPRILQKALLFNR